MSDGTKIEWTEATWNPITGCSVVSPGCTNCYAMKLAGGRLAHHPSREGLTHDSKAGPVWTGEVRFNEQWADLPLRWKRPRMIFVCAHGDLFHPDVPDAWIDKVFAVMALASRHRLQVLTKRAERMRAYCTDPETPERIGRAAIGVWPGHVDDSSYPGFHWPLSARDRIAAPWPLPNVWLGVSAEDQARADERIPHLLATPAAVRWVSAEPLLGPLDLGELQAGIPDNAWLTWLDGLDWIVAGGESGPGARPMHPDWARSLRDQCDAAGVPFFFEQWGAWRPETADDAPPKRECDGTRLAYWPGTFSPPARAPGERYQRPAGELCRCSKKKAGALLDGQEWRQYPTQA